ncbi:MAG: hypothetical protein KUG82_15190 [Pseudomonadales bacterium]|nr:hypothetical protein [Pseudomonadales bacterium]
MFSCGTSIRNTLSFSLLMSTFFIASCGGGDGGGGGGGEVVERGISGFPQISEDTEWLLTMIPDEDSCDDSETASFILNINFDSADDTVSASLNFFETNPPLTVESANDTQIVLSGSYSDDDETTTLSNAILNFSGQSNIDTFSGTVDWRWQDSEEVCTGTANLSGTLRSSSGSIVDFESEEDDAIDTDNVLTGRFLDSAVAGLSYRTATKSGTTNANGEFTYLAGETVVFGLGDLEFPAVTAAQILTPLELAGVTDINNTGVVNMARLLQSLDQDCDPSNGITIGGEALLAAAGMALDFESPNFDTDVVDLVANGGQQNSACQVLIDASQAVAHLQQTLDSLNNQTTPPIGNGLIGKIGIWEGEGQQQGISWTIRINIQDNEQTIEYPSLNCGGTLDLLEESEAQLVFRETITFGISGCVNQGFVELTDQSEDELIYRWYYPGGNNEQGLLGAIGSVTKVQ